MMTQTPECPVCTYTNANVKGDDGGLRVDCARCGSFWIGTMAAHHLKNKGEPWSIRASCWIRHRFLDGDTKIRVTKNDLPIIEATWRDRSVSEKQQALLLALAKLSRCPGVDVPIFAQADFVLAWCESREEFDFHLETLRKRKLVDSPSMKASWIVTPEGWDRVSEIAAAAPKETGLVFVAMAFDPILTPAWPEGFQPGISLAGYRPARVDTYHHNGKIDDRIMAMIREAQFVVVDVTLQNRGAYFEAGFALGLGREVIWSVRHDEIDQVHFDVRQFNHIVWNDEEDLRVKIRDRVLGVFGRGPVGE